MNDTVAGGRAARSAGSDGVDDPQRILECWLTELERLDGVLHAQSDYLDAVESGAATTPPPPFVGTPGLPELPATLTSYARDLVERNEAVTQRAMTLSAQLRPRHQRPLHVPSQTVRGNRLELQA